MQTVAALVDIQKASEYFNADNLNLDDRRRGRIERIGGGYKVWSDDDSVISYLYKLAQSSVAELGQPMIYHLYS